MDRAKLREDLVAYVDGELPAAEAREIESWIAADPDAQELRRHLQEDALALRGLFGAALREPVPATLTAAVGAAKAPPAPAGGTVVELARRAQPRPVARWLAAAAIAGLVIGGLGGFLGERQRGKQEITQLQQQLVQTQQQGRQEIAQLQQQLAQMQQQLAAAQQPQPWIMQVAQYHKIYAREQRHLVEVPAEETSHIEQWLGKRLDDLAFKVPDLSAFGLTFKGARMLVVGGAPVAQLVYLPADGRAVALCVIHSKKDDKPLTASQQDDLNLVDWRMKGYGFVLIGWESQDELRAIAEASEKSFSL
jgi:anti-sigma factor RsiW